MRPVGKYRFLMPGEIVIQGHDMFIGETPVNQPYFIHWRKWKYRGYGRTVNAMENVVRKME